jgi:hypothetical protein
MDEAERKALAKRALGHQAAQAAIDAHKAKEATRSEAEKKRRAEFDAETKRMADERHALACQVSEAGKALNTLRLALVPEDVRQAVKAEEREIRLGLMAIERLKSDLSFHQEQLRGAKDKLKGFPVGQEPKDFLLEVERVKKAMAPAEASLAEAEAELKKRRDLLAKRQAEHDAAMSAALAV